jgi:hypothetical protein
MAKKKRRRIPVPVSKSHHRFEEYKLGDVVRHGDHDYDLNGRDMDKKMLHLTRPGEGKWVPFAETELLPF